MTKPFDPRDVVEALDDLLTSQREQTDVLPPPADSRA